MKKGKGKAADKGEAGGTRKGYLTRETLLSLLTAAVQRTERKVLSGRIRNIDNEKLRLENLRCLGYLCSVYNNILRDNELSDIEKRLTILENQKKKKEGK